MICSFLLTGMAHWNVSSRHKYLSSFHLPQYSPNPSQVPAATALAAGKIGRLMAPPGTLPPALSWDFQYIFCCQVEHSLWTIINPAYRDSCKTYLSQLRGYNIQFFGLVVVHTLSKRQVTGTIWSFVVVPRCVAAYHPLGPTELAEVSLPPDIVYRWFGTIRCSIV